ncbi:MAG: hypothetical protein ABFE08_08750 [Armatimonadia bacterium]
MSPLLFLYDRQQRLQYALDELLDVIIRDRDTPARGAIGYQAAINKQVTPV